VRVANDVFRFVLELCMLAALGYGGFEAASGAFAWVLLVALPLAAAVVWGMFLAPKARRPTVDPLRILLEAAVFAAAGAALVAAGRTALGILLWIAAAVHLALTFALGQRPRGR
jgi:Protein of unknown function (DUF2568)